MSIDIGGRLRYVRMRQNLSQREVAREARCDQLHHIVDRGQPVQSIRLAH